MQTHHPVNYQLNHQSLNPSLNHNLINTFNHGHHNYSINTSQTNLNQPNSPILSLFHPNAQQPNLQATSQQQATTQRQTQTGLLHNAANLLDLIDNNINNLRLNQRNQLNGHLNEVACQTNQHCLTNYCGASNTGALSAQSNGQQTAANLINQLNGNTNSINANNYQRNVQQQNHSPRLSPSRHRFRNNRWPRFLNNNYQTNLHSNASNNNPNNSHPSIMHTNRPNTLVYSPTVQSPLSPLLNNLTPANNSLFANGQQATPSVDLFNNGLVDNLYAPADNNCTNGNLPNLNNLTSSQQQGNQGMNYHNNNRRFNNLNNSSRSRQRANNINNNLSNNNNNNNLNANSFNHLLNTQPFINTYNPNLVVPISNVHPHSPAATNNSYFVNNNNLINEHYHLMRLIALASLDNNNSLQVLQNHNHNLQILNPVLYHNLNLINSNAEFLRIFSQLTTNSVANSANHFPHLNNHYSNQYFHHNNSSNQNQASGSNSNANTNTASNLQEQNYEALINLAHSLGQAKTRGLSKAEIDLIPSYKYRSSSCSKSIHKSTTSFKAKQQCTNTNNNKSTTAKLCKHHTTNLNSNNKRRLIDNNNNNANLPVHSDDEELFDELELDDLQKKDKLSTKDSDKLNSKRNSKCIKLNTKQTSELLNDELDECCDFICENDQEDEDEKMICVICMCDFEIKQVLRVLPCNHEYHKKCLDRWLLMNRTCPVCRQLI